MSENKIFFPLAQSIEEVARQVQALVRFVNKQFAVVEPVHVAGPEDAPTSGDRVLALSSLPSRQLVHVWVSESAFGAPGGTQGLSVTGEIQEIEADKHYLALANSSGELDITVNLGGSGTRHVVFAYGVVTKSIQLDWA